MNVLQAAKAALTRLLGNQQQYQYSPVWTMRLYDNVFMSYAELYRTQPNVRTCVDFLARNVAQLGLHVYERVNDLDRRRLTDHPLARLLKQPNSWTTRYRLIESLMGDLGVYFNAYWLKWRVDGVVTRLVRIPPELVTVEGGFMPENYRVDVGTSPLVFPAQDVVHFRGYNPSSSTAGLSPLETLRRILAEEHAMGDYREGFWRNAARMSGIIERPREAPNWSDAAQQLFKEQWAALYSGTDNSGKTAVLEEGMTWKPMTFNAQESEYLASRKLTREECARAYHIPLPMVGILDHATFSNIREQHQNLYQDCLSPWLKMIEEEIELQLVPEFDDSGKVYVEFNIAEKMAGDFEEQIRSLQAAVGRPWMTANEARARLNMPQLAGDANALVTPLNVLVGGQASPRDAAPKALLEIESKATPGGRINPYFAELREQHEKKWVEFLVAFFERQRQIVMSRVRRAETPADVWQKERFDSELGTDLYKLSRATAVAWARRVAELLSYDFYEENMDDFLLENSRIAAENINHATLKQIEAVWDESDRFDAVKNVFAIAVAARAAEIACSRVTTTANYGTVQAARHGGLRTKTWRVNSANPRDAHAMMDGETVAIGELFSNGMAWPGDPAGGPENNSNCRCSVEFGR